MELHFFPIEFKYKIREGQPYIYMYGKLEDNTRICVIQHYLPYFYAKVYNINLAQLERRLKGLEIDTNSGPAKVVKWESVEKELLGKKDSFWKIYTNQPKAVPIISKEISSWGLDCYEKDILFVHRYLRDKKISPMTLIKVEGDFVDGERSRIPVFLAESVEPFSKESVKKLVKKIAENFHLPYFTITPTFSICPKHGYIAGDHEYCPKCDSEIGYIVDAESEEGPEKIENATRSEVMDAVKGEEGVKESESAILKDSESSATIKIDNVQ